VDQVIAFIRKQESDLLRPMAEAVSVSEARIDKSLQQAATANQVQAVGQNQAHLIEQLNKLLPVHQREAAATRATTEKLLQEHTKRELAAFEVLSRFLDEKGKGGLLASITKAFKE
jgi:vacuolar-type H+-ATPase subunit I/STV1